MEGLKVKKYLQVTRKRFDPTALVLSIGGILAVLFSASTIDMSEYFFDLRSILIVIGGTVFSLLFQFDFSSMLHSLFIIMKSFFGTPDKRVIAIIQQLDDAIINDVSLTDLRDGSELDGELLNDIVYMHQQGLLFEEIDEFVTSRIADEFLGRKVAVDLLSKAAMIAPALGLFGTVIGLIGVLKSLSDPTQIGPSMSLALMTTAYGAGMGSLIFTPLAGRLEHHNAIYLEVHKQLLSKVGVLLSREERRIDKIILSEGSANEIG